MILAAVAGNLIIILSAVKAMSQGQKHREFLCHLPVGDGSGAASVLKRLAIEIRPRFAKVSQLLLALKEERFSLQQSCLVDRHQTVALGLIANLRYPAMFYLLQTLVDGGGVDLEILRSRGADLQPDSGLGHLG